MTGRLALLVKAAVLLALIPAGLAVSSAAHTPLPGLRAAVVVIAVFGAGVTIHVRTRIVAQRLELGWSEAALVLSLALVPPAWAVLLTPVGVGLALAFRLPAAKAVYTVSAHTLASAAGAAVVAVAGPYRPDSARGVLALVLAGVAAGLVSHAAAAIFVAVAQDIPVSAGVRARFDVQVLSTAGNVTAATVTLGLAHRDPRLIAVLPVVGLCLHLGYLGRLRSQEERTLAQRQMRAVSVFADDMDEALVAARAAVEVANLLAVDVVDVEVYGRDGRAATLHRHARRGEPWSGPPDRAPVVAGRLVTQVPVAGDPYPLGLIRVWLAGGDPGVQLSKPDEVAVRTFAAALRTALANARTHDRVRAAAERQAYQATHDRATDLPTYDLLLEHVERCLAGVRDAGADTAAAACVIEIGGLREIARTLGRTAGQRLLAHAADQLRRAAAPGHYAAHLGGESFGVFLQPARDPEQVRARVLGLLTAVGAPVRADPGGTEVSLDACAGIAYCAPATSAAELLRRATAARDRARDAGLRVAFYEPACDSAGPPAFVLASELRAALDRREFEVLYQPIVDLAHYWPVGVEATVRWLHPVHGLLRPEQFLPALHRTPVDRARFVRWYLDHALAERARWGPEDLPVAVNLDSRSLLDDGLVDHVARAIGQAGLAPDQLTVELTETAEPSSVDAVDDVVARLRYLGTRLAVDDFGAGPGSLARLLRLPATDVKIAAELIIDMLKSEQAAALVRAAIDIGRGLGRQVTALGVTTAEQAAALRDFDCPAAQGRHLVPALTPSRLRAYLAEAPRPPASTAADVIVLETRRPTSDRGR
jgi:diguanylate cyclase